MIFNLFKAKPTLKELIPEGFVDIHSHILPGIDDGAKDVEESIKLITQMKELGFSKIIATPHTYQGVYNNTNESIKNAYLSIKNKVKNSVKIEYSSEYMIDNTILKKIEQKNLLSLKGNYILVEMSYISAPKDLFDIIFQLQLNGYIPVIAHPERYRFYFDNSKDLKKLKLLGCKFQLNLFSTTDYYGKDVRIFTEYLINNQMYAFVGSDIHKLSQIKNFSIRLKINNVKELKKLIDNTIETFS